MHDLPPSDEMDTIAYAVSFYEAAGVIARSDPKRSLTLPLYALIGFAIENGLKATLEYANPEQSKGWQYSHDLNLLLIFASNVGLRMDADVFEFVTHISVAHKEHHFRYPQKAGVINLPSNEFALDATNRLLESAFHFIDGASRLDG